MSTPTKPPKYYADKFGLIRDTKTKESLPMKDIVRGVNAASAVPAAIEALEKGIADIERLDREIDRHNDDCDPEETIGIQFQAEIIASLKHLRAALAALKGDQ